MESSKDFSRDLFTIWANSGVYEVEKSGSKPKWFQIFAYPGPSGFLHVGTLRSYTYPDVIAKFKRFTGHNVYFPAGIHASGLPAVQFSENVRSGKYDKYLEVNNCTAADIKQLKTPKGVVYFFRNNYASIWKQMGFFINQQTGIPTTIDPGYQKFIEWQFRTLYKKGFLVQREYVSSYCPKDGPVSIDTAETDLSSGGNAKIIETMENGVKKYIFSEPVICRCGEPVQIRHVPDQWFIKYSDENITNESINHVKHQMNIFPSSYAKQIPDVLNWFSDRPCVRTGSWLGTKFPIKTDGSDSNNFIIEPIADSTIYPAYYIISKYIVASEVTVSSLNDEFFDFIFFEQGNIESVAKSTGINPKVIAEIQQDFANWYPLDCNFGGKEHKTVHFPVFIKMHTMMFSQKLPKAIFVNWWVMQDIKTNAKIAKSKGGAGTVTQVINTYSADAIRLYYCHTASAHVDIEWSEIRVSDYQKEIKKIKHVIFSIYSVIQSSKNNTNDLIVWLEYKLHSYFSQMYDFLEHYDIRNMAQICYYTIPSTLLRYNQRNGIFNESVAILINEWLVYLAMITPFMAEEINFKVGNKQSVFSNTQVLVKPSMMTKPSIVAEEDFIDIVITDIIKIIKAVKASNNKTVFVFTHNKIFTSKKTENEVLTSALSYITSKTMLKIVIDPSNTNFQKVGESRPRKPKIILY